MPKTETATSKRRTPKRAELNEASILSLLRRKRHTTDELCKATGGKPRQINRLIKRLQESGSLVYQFGEQWALEKAPAPQDATHRYLSHPDGTYRFGFTADNHACSKYERLDVLNDLYDKFADRGVDRVLHAGNWIDGEARFNKHDLKVHGMEPQIRYLIDTYPQRKGIVTYSVAGDDHEGWYGQREGIDIGKHAEQMMRAAGRSDWVNLGYMEAYLQLRHVRTGASTQALLMHPGGGSAYAISYKPQKIVESFSGGSKPAVVLIGHYHKESLNIVRNVWAIQCACTQDQTPFMRKRQLDAHVGGGICTLSQDANGAIVACAVEFFNYFDSGYYNDRFSHGGSITLPKRRNAA